MIIISGYHPPPQLPGNRPPPYKESPRDFMLKDPHETGPTVSSDVDTTSPVPAIQNPSPPEPLIFSRRFKFPSFVSVQAILIKTMLGNYIFPCFSDRSVIILTFLCFFIKFIY